MRYCIAILLSVFFLSFTAKENTQDVIVIVSGTQLFSEEEITSYSYIKQGDWYGLSQQANGTFSLKKTSPAIHETYIECWDQHIHILDCEGVVTLQGKSFTERKVPNHPLSKEQSAIYPGNSYSFEWNDKTYKLRAEAETTGEKEPYDIGSWNHFKNYKLYLSDGEKEQLFFVQPFFLDTKSEILFLGDLDNDGKLDILMSDPSDYEIVSMCLYLSTMASEDEIVGVAGSGGYSTDC